MLVNLHTHLPTSAKTPRAVGLHPWQAAEGKLPCEEDVLTTDVVGEIGLDKCCKVNFEQQKQCFEHQLRLAEKHQKTVVLHVVHAFEEVITMLKRHTLKAVVFHGFIGSKEQAMQAIKQGYFLSFGARTESSPKTIEALRHTPLDSLFVETDEAAVTIEDMYATIARLRGVSMADLEEATTKNYARIVD